MQQKNSVYHFLLKMNLIILCIELAMFTHISCMYADSSFFNNCQMLAQTFPNCQHRLQNLMIKNLNRLTIWDTNHKQTNTLRWRKTHNI